MGAARTSGTPELVAHAESFKTQKFTWFLSSPLIIIRVPFFLPFGFSRGAPKIKRAKGYYSGT